MIQRVVLVKLKPPHANDKARALIAGETVKVLRNAHGVLDVRVGTASDTRTRSAWDLSILVQFADMEDVETYRTDKIHRAYADVFLKPLREAIRVYNFEVPDRDDDQRS